MQSKTIHSRKKILQQHIQDKDPIKVIQHQMLRRSLVSLVAVVGGESVVASLVRGVDSKGESESHCLALGGLGISNSI